jgi:hypothetical protein
VCVCLWGGIGDPSSITNVALAAKHRLVVTEPCFRGGNMVREINALKTRSDIHTFLTHSESERVDGGIVGGLLQANKEVYRKGASASMKTIAEDRAKKHSRLARKRELKVKYRPKPSLTSRKTKAHYAATRPQKRRSRPGGSTKDWALKRRSSKRGSKRCYMNHSSWLIHVYTRRTTEYYWGARAQVTP